MKMCVLNLSSISARNPPNTESRDASNAMDMYAVYEAGRSMGSKKPINIPMANPNTAKIISGKSPFLPLQVVSTGDDDLVILRDLHHDIPISKELNDAVRRFHARV